MIKNENISDIDTTPYDTTADMALCRRVVEGDPAAGDEFYHRYHKLVRHLARRALPGTNGGVVDGEDLVQAGLVYMISQAGTYRGDKGVPFHTYAAFYMPQRLKDVVDGQYGIHIPQDIQGIISRINVIDTARMSRGQHYMTDEEISTEFNIPLGPPDDQKITVGALRQTFLLTRHMGSLDSSGYSGHDADDSPGNQYVMDERTSLTPIHGESMNLPEHKAEMSAMRGAIASAVGNLVNEDERRVIRMRFGFDGNEPMSFREIGVALGVTSESARLIESRARYNLLRDPILDGLQS